MNHGAFIEIRIGRGAVILMMLSLTLALAVLLLPGNLQAQKTQDSFREKFNIAEESSGVGIATSADGKYVYVVGPGGILVSGDFGKTGSWSQTVRLK